MNTNGTNEDGGRRQRGGRTAGEVAAANGGVGPGTSASRVRRPGGRGGLVLEGGQGGLVLVELVGHLEDRLVRAPELDRLGDGDEQGDRRGDQRGKHRRPR